MENTPDISERDYLKWLVLDRYCIQVEQQVDAIRHQATVLMREGKISEANDKEREFQMLQQRLLEQRMRSEDIIYWLYWDTQAREEGVGTYPDIYENSREARSVVARDF